MWIIVEDFESGEMIFEGEAEVFLDNNDWDEEIEETLNELDCCEIGTTVSIYGNQNDEYIITKLEKDYCWEEEE